MATRTLTEQERQARREADRQKTREAVEALRASDGWQQWLRLRRHFREYSLTNQLLIAIAMPDATRVAGFKAWLKLGYSVRRGERACHSHLDAGPAEQETTRCLAGCRRGSGRAAADPVPSRAGLGSLPGPAASTAGRASSAGPADHRT